MEDRLSSRDLVALQTVGPVPLASPRSLWWRVPTVAALYYLAARLGFLLDIEPGFASSIWPAAGIGSAALLTWPARTPEVIRRPTDAACGLITDRAGTGIGCGSKGGFGGQTE